MPSPTKRVLPRGDVPSSGGRGGGASSLEAIEGGGGGGGGEGRGGEGHRTKKKKRRRMDDDDPVDPTLVGKRTGVTVPPRGRLPFDSPGGLYEDVDAFFDAARSPGPGRTTTGLGGRDDGDEDESDGIEHRRGQRHENDANRRRRRVEEEKRRDLEEMEEEARRNAARRPDILNGDYDDYDDDEDDDYGKDGEQRLNMTKGRVSYQSTPKQPTWTNRMLHRAMGVPTDESPVSTVLSMVSAAPSTLGSTKSGGGSVDAAAAAASRHARREELLNQDDQFDRIARRGEGISLAAGGGDEDEVDFDHDSGPVDPPEETTTKQTKHSGNGRGMDPEERANVLEPEPNALENSLEEVVGANNERDDDDDDDDGGRGGMQLALQRRDGDKDWFENEEEDAYFGGQGDEFDLDPNIPVMQEEERSLTKDKLKKEVKKKKRQEREPVTPTSVLRTTNKSKKKHAATANRVNWSTPNGTSRGIPAGNRDYEAVPVSEYKDDIGEDPRTPGGSSLRRSRRARFAPLQFWKNEKLIYEAQNEEGILGEAMGDMPVVAYVQKAHPTPYKEVKRTVPERKKKLKKGGKRKNGRGDGDSDEGSDDDDTTASRKKFDDKALRKKYRVHNGESGKVWSETLESATETKIVSRIDNRTFSKLPLSSSRKNRESKVVGFASQGFHVPTDDDDLFPGYIAGNVVLPPRGIKDAEGVGLCSQVFNVGDCQPNSLEFALADPSGQDGEFDPKTAQRYLLSKGDMFQIPPGNVYRLENHSTTMKATLFWTIIKCTSRAEQDEDDTEEN